MPLNEEQVRKAEQAAEALGPLSPVQMRTVMRILNAGRLNAAAENEQRPDR